MSTTPPPVPTIPPSLKNAIESGDAVLFIGAGLGYYAFDDKGAVMPDGPTLSKELATTFGIDIGNPPPPLPKVAQLVEMRVGRAELTAFLTERFSKFEPGPEIKWLVSLPWRAIFTTNYDRLLERAFELSASPPRVPVSISAVQNMTAIDHRTQVPIYHLHGSLFDADSPQILITQKDYATFRNRRKMLFERMKQDFASSPVLYVGYSNADPNWQMLLAELEEEFQPRALPPGHRVTPSTDPIDREILKGLGINTIDASLDDFHTAVQSQLGTITPDAGRLDKFRSQVPPALRAAFERQAPATLRLLSSWTYVNQVRMDEDPRVSEFLKGDRPTWSLLGNRMHFTRDVEAPLYDEVLDYVTNPKPDRKYLLLLGSAGYGTTTALMSLSTRLAIENACHVFHHRPGTPIHEGDVEFAIQAVGGRPLFVVDNAADHAHSVQRAVRHLHSSRLVACFLMGERLNEWRQLNRPLRTIEYIIDSLSDPEINRLLECLEKNSALDYLAHLEPSARFAAVKTKHDKQLIMVLRELIENNSFDAIIEDEYRNILDERAKHIYATVACSYQMRQYLRDSLLARIEGLDLPEFYKAIKGVLDGVVEFEVIDDSSGMYGARCRHHAIAEIIWERCLPEAQRSDILLATLQHLNLTYYNDVQLFDALIQNDAQIDSISSFEHKVRFFEEACTKDPQNGYVRQHYARMLQREKRYDLALAEAEQGMKIAPQVRVLRHTRGIILRDMAFNAPNSEIGRRRLVQAEAAFREAITLNNRDAYAYQSLAELFLGWAKRLTDEAERLAYIERSQEVISEGLRRVDQRDGLWIAAATADELLGQTPKAVAHLARATNSPVARYLLARTFLSASQPEKAIAVLQPTIDADPTEYRSFIIYATALLRNGEPIKKAIAILRLAELHGMRDARFVATLGGLMFLDKQFTDSAEVFQRARLRNLPVEERRHRSFFPQDVFGSPLALTGVVVGTGNYSNLGAPGYPNVFCPSTRIDDVGLRKGMKVTFEVAFTGDGPIATNVSLG